MVVNEKLNLTMLCDFYELTMSQGYFANGYKDRITYFDLFFRRCPNCGEKLEFDLSSLEEEAEEEE